MFHWHSTRAAPMGASMLWMIWQTTSKIGVLQEQNKNCITASREKNKLTNLNKKQANGNNMQHVWLLWDYCCCPRWLSTVGCISIHLVHGVTVERSHSRGDVCCVSEGWGFVGQQLKGRQHGKSDRVQEGQCSEACSTTHSQEQRGKKSRCEVKTIQFKLILLTIYWGSSFSS